MSTGPASAGPGSGGRVGRTSLLLVPVALLARGAAFVVPAVIATWFGVGEITDAWYWALAFPTFALVLASASLGTTALPVVARLRAEAPAELPAVLGGLMVWAALGGGAFGGLICLTAGPVLEHLTEFAPQTRALALAFLWQLLPFMVLTTAATVARVGCEVHGRFLEVALTPILRAGTVIAVTWALLPLVGPHALPWGLVAGELAQLATWTAVLGLRTSTWPRPTLALHPAIRGVGRDLAPILGGEVLVALNLVVDKGFAALLDPGSVATLEFADRARVIPQTLLESTLLMVAFASWSNLFARGDRRQARAQVDQSLRWVLVLAAPVLAGMYIGRRALVGLLFEHGAFTAEDTLATAAVLGWYLPGVLPNLIGILAVRAHVVERNLRLVLLLGVVSVACNGLLNALLMGPMGLAGLALSTTLNMIVVPGLYLAALLHTWRGQGHAAAVRPWLVALGLAALSAAVAVGVELGFGPPADLASPVLWAASVPCFLLLGLGWRLTGGARPPVSA